MLNLRFFDTFHVIFSNGHEPAIMTAKAKALLAYLVTENDRPHRREQLAAMFWPEADQKSSAQSLRQALYGLRRLLQPTPDATAGEDAAYLTVTRQDVAFNFDSDHWSDVGMFAALLSATQQHMHRSLDTCPECITKLEEAVGLFKGEFLAGLTVADAERFEVWRHARQEIFHAQVVRSLLTITDFYEHRRDYNRAHQTLMRLIEIEPWDEESHRRIMRLLAVDGQRAAAMQQFDRARRLLMQELGIEPSIETIQLAQQIQNNELLEVARDLDVPYKGLYPFSLADSTDFYGREETVQYVLQQLEEQPIVFLIGPSGSGKSSIVHAGVLPVLLSIRQLPTATGQRLGATQTLWSIVEFRPGADPFRALAETLIRLHSATLPHARIDLAELTRSLTSEDAPRHALGLLHKHKRTLLFADQFEELYTLCDSPAVRRAFIDLLLHLAAGHDDAPQVSLLISMRADFTGQALTHRPFADALQRGGIVLGPMGRGELRRAIEEPARNRGVVFEAGLVDRLLDDVGEESGNLPLLQFALTELWVRRDGWQISHSVYDAIGRVAGALASYADQVFAQLDATEQTLARRLFVQLVQPGDETGDTRRPAIRSELGEPVWVLARKLADMRLVVTGHSDDMESVELVHETLIRNWSRLREWMDEDRDFRRWQQRLRTFLLHWQASGREDEALLRGLSLSEAARWVDVRRTELSQIEQTFIDASLAAHTNRQAAIERSRQQELEQVQRLAESEHQRAEIEHSTSRRLRWLTAALTLVSILAIGAAILAVLSRQEARQFAQQAIARQLAAQSINLADDATDLALLLSAEALSRMTDPADRAGLMSAFSISPLLDRYFWGGSGDIVNIAVAADGSQLLTIEFTGSENTVRLWDAASARASTTLLPSFRYTAIAVAPTGRYFATADGAVVRVWNGRSGDLLEEFTTQIEGADQINWLQFAAPGEQLTENRLTEDQLIAKTQDGVILMLDLDPLVEAARFLIPDGEEGAAASPDGRLLAITQDIGEERGVNLWRTDTGEPTGVRLGGHTANLGGVTFTADGRRAATASFDGTVRLWDTESGELLFGPLIDHSGRVLSVAFSPDGSMLATGGADHRIYLYDLNSRKAIGKGLIGHSNWVRSLQFDAQGDTLYSGTIAGELIRWDIMAQRQLLVGHTGRVRAVALSPDGETLATASFDRRVLLWDAQRGQPIAELPPIHENSVLQVAFSPDGRYLASGDGGGLVVLWDIADRQMLYRWPDPGGSVSIALAFSPDSRYLAGGFFSGMLSLWDVSTGRQASTQTPAHDGWVLSLAFSPNGRVAATGGSEGKIKLWDVASLNAAADEPLTPIGNALEGHTYWVTSLLWSADSAALLSSGADNTVRFWDVAKQQQTAAPLTLDSQVWGIQFYPPHGEQSLLTLGVNGSIFLWDLATRTPLAPALNTNLETESFAVSPRGDIVFLASIDERAEKWWLDPRPWLQRSCETAARTLTEDEWGRFLDELPYQPVCTSASPP